MIFKTNLEVRAIVHEQLQRALVVKTSSFFNTKIQERFWESS